MINIVCVDISQISENSYQHLLSRASAERQKRAERYRRREDKVRCVTADALIRYAVRQTLNSSEFTVAQEDGGKPYIVGREDFYFNLSHSGRWVVIAYGDSQVGIDVQEIRMDVRKERIAHQFFTAAEQEYIFQPTESHAVERFFQVWTAKESYLKYLGTGLRRPLDSFCVVPDGSHLGVSLNSTFLGDYCMTLCTTDEHATITQLSVRQLIEETQTI